MIGLSGRSALVTGSTRGIGAAIASALEGAGVTVLRHGHEAVEDQRVLVADFASGNGVEILMEKSWALAPDLSLLVCNAGGFFDVPFLEMTEDRWEKTMRINLRSSYFLIRAFSQKLIQSKREGVVVIVSSTNGFQPEAGSSCYDISKGGLVMMVRSLALELASHGIRVNGLAPGLIRTPLTSSWMDARPEKVRHYQNKILCGQIGTPEDCADPCVFLCSDASRYIYGQTLIVDGGLTVGQIGEMS